MTSACYGGCPLLDTSNVRIAYHGRRVLELLWRSLRTRCLCQPSLLPTENNAFSWSFPPDLKPARQLSTCNQWAGIPYRWHFRIRNPAWMGAAMSKTYHASAYVYRAHGVVRYSLYVPIVLLFCILLQNPCIYAYQLILYHAAFYIALGCLDPSGLL